MDSFSYQNGGQNRDQDFQKLSQTIGTSIQKITQNVSSMQRMVNQIGTHQDSPELRKQLYVILINKTPIKILIIPDMLFNITPNN